MSDDLLPLLVPKSAQASLATERTEADALTPTVLAIVIRGPEDEQFLADIRAHLKAKIAQIEAARTSVTGHLTAAKKAVDAQYMPARKAYEAVVELINDKLSEVETARRKAALQAQLDATKLATTGTFVVLAEPTRAPAGIGYTDTWQHKETNLVALAKAIAEGRAPVEFLRLDHSAVKIWLRTFKDSTVCPAIDGLEFERISVPRSV